MKRTCQSCRALQGDYCVLGIKTRQDKRGLKIVRPLEDCDKPMTWDRLDYLFSIKLASPE